MHRLVTHNRIQLTSRHKLSTCCLPEGSCADPIQPSSH